MNIIEHQKFHDWLRSLKSGDEVAEIRGSHFRRAYYISRVERVTKTQIVMADGCRFRINDGRRVGDTYGYRIEPITQKIRDAIEATALSSWFFIFERKVSTGIVKIEIMRAMKNVYDEAMKNESV